MATKIPRCTLADHHTTGNRGRSSSQRMQNAGTTSGSGQANNHCCPSADDRSQWAAITTRASVRVPERTLSAQVVDLHQLHPAARSLTSNAAGTLFHAFISRRQDYCNSLYYGITNKLLQRLQSVQNAAVRELEDGTRSTPFFVVCTGLFVVKRRIEYKLAMLMIGHSVVSYCRTSPTTSLTSTSGGCRLRSSDAPTFAILRTRIKVRRQEFLVRQFGTVSRQNSKLVTSAVTSLGRKRRRFYLQETR